MVHSFLAEKVFGEGLAALVINLVALLGTIASFSIMEDTVRYTIIGLDIVIAVLSIKWLTMKGRQTRIELEKLKIEKLKYEQKNKNENPDKTDKLD